LNLKCLSRDGILPRAVQSAALLFAAPVLLRAGLSLNATIILLLLLSLGIVVIGSLSELVFSLSLSIVSFSAALMLLDITRVDTRAFYPPSIYAFIVVGVFSIIFLRSIPLTKSWRHELTAILVSTATLYLTTNKDLWTEGGALAAIFHAEDNAAWALTVNRAAFRNDLGPGNYGALLDVLFSAVHGLTVLGNDLGHADRIAVAIVGTSLLLLAINPFLINAVLRLITPTVSLVHLAGIQIAAAFILIHFIFIGHFATGLAVQLTILLVLFVSSMYWDKIRVSFSYLVVLAVVAVNVSATWFPLSLFSVGLMISLSRGFRGRSRSDQFVVFLTIICASVLIAFREIYPRVSFFRAGNSSLVTGIETLLTIEGGGRRS